MTLEEKIGQMVQVERSVATPDAMKNYFIGSVLSGGGSVPAAQASAETWVNTVDTIQKGFLSTRLGIPMIYGIDAVHGHNNVYKATIFPPNVGLGATRDPQLVKRIGEATALKVRATGNPYVFAPCIADPLIGSSLQLRYITGYVALILAASFAGALQNIDFVVSGYKELRCFFDLFLISNIAVVD